MRHARVGNGVCGDCRGAPASAAERCDADVTTIRRIAPRQAKPRSGHGARARERTTIILIWRPCLFPTSLTWERHCLETSPDLGLLPPDRNTGW